MITLQVLGRSNNTTLTIIYYNSAYEPLFSKNREKLPLGVSYVSWDYQDSEKMIYDDFLSRFESESGHKVKKCILRFFFSLRDLYFLFSEEFISGLFRSNFPRNRKAEYIVKKRIHFGQFAYGEISHELHDLSGWTLESFINLLL